MQLVNNVHFCSERGFGQHVSVKKKKLNLVTVFRTTQNMPSASIYFRNGENNMEMFMISKSPFHSLKKNLACRETTFPAANMNRNSKFLK